MLVSRHLTTNASTGQYRCRNSNPKGCPAGRTCKRLLSYECKAIHTIHLSILRRRGCGWDMMRWSLFAFCQQVVFSLVPSWDSWQVAPPRVLPLRTVTVPVDPGGQLEKVHQTSQRWAPENAQKTSMLNETVSFLWFWMRQSLLKIMSLLNETYLFFISDSAQIKSLWFCFRSQTDHVLHFWPPHVYTVDCWRVSCLERHLKTYQMPWTSDGTPGWKV